MKLYSNEIVFRGHPDKVCDQISDALLDAYLKEDKTSRCGIEVMGGKGKIFITGEVTSKAQINIKNIVKRVLKDIGYKTDYEIINNLGLQSEDIALGTNDEIGGAGDQGMMFGYACDDTEEMLPLAQVILQKLSMWYDEKRKECQYLFPDGKAQITGYYDENMKLKKIKYFTVSYQNDEKHRDYTDNLIKEKCLEICQKYNIEIEKFLINPTGKFEIGGFDGDTGLTGRKIAKEYLKKHNLKWCQVQISYAIGLEKPLAIYIDSDKGNIKVKENLYDECTPKNIIKDLNLLNISYEKKARFGHFTK